MKVIAAILLFMSVYGLLHNIAAGLLSFGMFVLVLYAIRVFDAQERKHARTHPPTECDTMKAMEQHSCESIRSKL